MSFPIPRVSHYLLYAKVGKYGPSKCSDHRAGLLKFSARSPGSFRGPLRLMQISARTISKGWCPGNKLYFAGHLTTCSPSNRWMSGGDRLFGCCTQRTTCSRAYHSLSALKRARRIRAASSRRLKASLLKSRAAGRSMAKQP